VSPPPSSICYVFGEEGRPHDRGYDIHDLADHSTFEETAYLLLRATCPRATAQALVGQLKADQKPAPVVGSG